MSRWIHAHAGSGKTYALVQQILGLLVRGVAPQGIVCLTYTNAAAAEMKDRLYGRLRELALMEDTQVDARFRELTGQEATAEDIARCKGLYLALLDCEPGIGFFTLHGFCQRILSGFPLEAGVPAYFSLLDDRASAALLAQAYSTLLRAALTDASLREALDTLHAQAAENYARDLLYASIRQRRQWQVFWSQEAAEARIDAHFAVGEHRSLASLLAGRYTPQRLESLKSLAAQTMQGNEVLAAGIHAWCDSVGEAAWERYALLWLTKEKTPRKSLVPAAFGRAHPTLLDALREEQALVSDAMERWLGIEAARLSRAVSSLTEQFLRFYDEEKFALQALDYDDLLLKTVALLGDERMRPWVMYKLDQRIEHLLIDEAQDTSPEQWAILEAIFTELMQAGASDKTVFVVGDLKQSIYSFQGAAPALFAEQKPKLAAQLAFAGNTLVMEHLELSRRSVPVVMEAVNRACGLEVMQGSFVAQEGYRPHRSAREGQGGRVVCWPPVAPPELEKADVLVPVDAYGAERDAVETWAEDLAATIAAWLESGRLLVARGRAIRADDVLILLQKRGKDSAFAQAIIRALERHAIQVAGLDRLQLAGHLAVQDHMALLEWCLHPYDDYHLAIALRSPLGGMSEEELLAVAQGRGEVTLWESLQARMPEHVAIARFVQWAEASRTMGPHALLQHMHACGAVREAYARRFGVEVFEVLDTLVAQAEAYAMQPDTSLRGFVSFMAEDTSELKREAESGQGKVRVMTVHGAKGLEAPVVILADALSKPIKRDLLLFAQTPEGPIPCLRVGRGKDAPAVVRASEARMDVVYAEYYRLLYVAMTRAADELYIGGVAPRRGAGDEDSPFPSWHAVMMKALRGMEHVVEDEEMISVEWPQEEGRAFYQDKHSRDAVLSDALPAFFARALPDEHRGERVYSPSSLVAHGTFVHASAGAADRGVVIHRVLQWVERTKPGSLEDVLLLVAREAPHWPQAECASAAKDIWAVYTDASLRWLWEGEAFNEVNIAGNILVGGKRLRLAGQIDRLIRTPDARIIIDYKTSRRVPPMDGLPEAYLMQMLAYKRLLEADGSDVPVRAGLLYTAGPVLYMLDNMLQSLDLPSLDAA